MTEEFTNEELQAAWDGLLTPYGKRIAKEREAERKARMIVAGGYVAPFQWETSKDGEVVVYDADFRNVTAFNTHTQLSLDDEGGLREELAEAEAFAAFMVAALNEAATKLVHENVED